MTKFVMDDILKRLGRQDDLTKKERLIESYSRIKKKLNQICPELAVVLLTYYTQATYFKNERDKFEEIIS